MTGTDAAYWPTRLRSKLSFVIHSFFQVRYGICLHAHYCISGTYTAYGHTRSLSAVWAKIWTPIMEAIAPFMEAILTFVDATWHFLSGFKLRFMGAGAELPLRAHADHHDFRLRGRTRALSPYAPRTRCPVLT